MRITRVELDNIKSYRHAVVPFRAGTTAIRGHNGAGKSTLVEAIGFALFDSLNYDQSQFVREGEKYGTVTVTFVSALDDRDYQAVRRCGSNAAWYIYDPQLGVRTAEQKVDVSDFLRKHLRLETEMKLSDLFNDALGVPQGTFTADFLLTPGNRKKKFDALLQVEDYRNAAEKLNATKNYLVEERRQIERRIEDLERETDQLDGWRTRLGEERELERTLAERLEAIGREVVAIEGQRETLRQREAQVTRTASAAQVAVAAHEAAAAKYEGATQRLAEARQAARVREETRADHEAHGVAQAQLNTVRTRMRERDDWMAQRATVAQEHAATASALQHTQAQLDEAERAARRIVELLPAVDAQRELEAAKDEARRDCQTLDDAQRALGKARQEAQALSEQITAIERLLAELETLRPLAEELEVRRERVAMLQNIRGMRTEREKQLQSVVAEQAKANTHREEAAQEEAKARENVRKLLDARELAEQVPALEAEIAQIDRQMHTIEVRQEHNRLSREQSGSGNCPFLREPCLNIRQRGENSLASYFDRLIAEDEAALRPLRTQREEVGTALTAAQERKRYYDKLEYYQDKLRAATERLAERIEQVETLAQQRMELEGWLASSPDVEDVKAAQVAFKECDDADKQLRQVEPRQAELQRNRELLAARETEIETHRRQVAAVAHAPETLKVTEAELAALGDPRREATALEGTAKRRAQIEQEVTTLKQRLAASQARLAEIEAALAPYSDIDAQERAVTAQIERTRPGHTRYLQHEQLAARLGEFEQAGAVVERELVVASQARDAAAAAYAEARAAFDPEALARVSQQADALGAERGSVTERLRHTQEESARLTGEIARVEALLDDLHAAREERAATDDVERMLQQFRDTIKEAGPNIMKALLRQISVEANRIFGEILGDRSAQLSWESDYEIMLRRDGKERSFAQLSGGEQMSAALAVRLALLRSLTRLDIAFFDEPTQNMDGERRGNLAEQIRRVRGFEQLIVISHDDTFEQGLDNVVHLEKRGGETVLVEEDALVAV